MYVIKLTDYTQKPIISSAFHTQKEEIKVMAW